MTKDIAIEVEDLSKTFRVREQKIDSIRKYIYSLFRPKSHIKTIKAVSDVSFRVGKGEFFGIIGHNGSGKSTLLQLIMGSYRPDSGSHIKVNGKMMRLALGMGFDANLSARDNIYINGSMIGLTFKEIGEKFKEIIEFAEIQDFIDTPLKYYSSGMKSKLSFSVAIHTKSDILLIDEFFGGVGDLKFKEKSEKVFLNTFLDGRTIVFVSHDLNKIAKYCNRVLLMHKGEAIMIGEPSEAIRKYKSLSEINEK